MKFLRILLITALVVCLTSFAYSKTDILFFVAGNHFLRAETTYEPGVNDFSIVHPHTTAGVGVALYYTGGGRFFSFFSGIEVHYNNFMSWGGIKLGFIPQEYWPQDTFTMEDPSDGDTLQVPAYKNVGGFVTLGINLYRSTLLTLFVNGGGGILYILDPPSGTYTSDHGIETVVEAPEKNIAPAAFGGAGVALGFVKFFSVFVNVRYYYIFSASLEQIEEIKKDQTGISVLVGLMIKL
ncbi:MAG: hypothetical protein ACE5LC_05920 [Candidatus Aminicenantales bacterium]